MHTKIKRIYLLFKKINVNFGIIKHKTERVAPLCLFSQRNNPYCDLLEKIFCKDRKKITKNQTKQEKNENNSWIRLGNQ